MSIKLHKADFERLPKTAIDPWLSIPTATISDAMNRQNVMTGRINSLISGSKLVGQARTVSVLAGDNSAIHAIINLLNAGDVLVIDGGSYYERALWGGILNSIAQSKGVSGVVIDGAIRDTLDLKRMGIPIFFAAATPAGPHKGWGGNIDSAISCGGVSVSPGDIIVGDDDGVVAVPLKQWKSVLENAKERIIAEQAVFEKIHKKDFDRVSFHKTKIEIIE